MNFIKKVISTIIVASMFTSGTVVFAKDTNDKQLEQIKQQVLSKNYMTLEKVDSKLSKQQVKENVFSNRALIDVTKSVKDTPEDAIEINTDFAYSDELTDTNDINWYKVNSEDFAKLTTYIQFNADMDFSTNIYKSEDGTSDNLQLIQSSPFNLFTRFDQIAYLTDNAWYYISIQSNNSSGSYSFITAGSKADVSQYEPNDNFIQSNNYTSSLSVVETIDNPYDEDWSKLTITEDATYAITFKIPTGASLALNIWTSDFSSGDSIDTLESGTYTIPLAKGDYYFRVLGSTNLSPDEYSMTVSQQNSIANSVVVNKIETTRNGAPDRIDYGYGRFWRVYRDMTVTGVAYNSDGQVAPNALVTVAVQTVINETITTASGYTDSLGNFKINMSSIPPAAGDFSYYNGTSTHYFDIIPMIFVNSNADQMDSNDTFLYHFAYSM